MYITLECGTCDNLDCPFPKAIWTDKEGCTRDIDEEVANKLYHYQNEVIPFWRLKNQETVDKEYREIMDFLYDYIYNAPIGNKIAADGKVDMNKKWKNDIAAFNLGIGPRPQYHDDSEFAKKLAELF